MFSKQWQEKNVANLLRQKTKAANVIRHWVRRKLIKIRERKKERESKSII